MRRSPARSCPSALPAMRPPDALYFWYCSPRSLSMKKPVILLFCAALCISTAIAEAKTELGDINGAKFRIDVPEKWNGGLVIYCHGYNPTPVTYKEGKLPPVFEVFTNQGYALAQSGY